MTSPSKHERPYILNPEPEVALSNPEMAIPINPPTMILVLSYLKPSIPRFLDVVCLIRFPSPQDAEQAVHSFQSSQEQFTEQPPSTVQEETSVESPTQSSPP